MGKRPTNWWMWTKAIVAGLGIAIGGPIAIQKITPTQEEVFQRYSPELQKKSLEGRYAREKEFDDFVCKLKEYSKSDRNIWLVMAEADKKEKRAKKKQIRMAKAAREKMRQEIRDEAGVALD